MTGSPTGRATCNASLIVCLILAVTSKNAASLEKIASS
jgi:hypothetical protein